MSAPFPARVAARVLLSTAGVFAAVLVLSGCDQGYSPDMVYPARHDPVFSGTPPTDELTDPDRPGQLPVLSLLNAEEPGNPLNKALTNLLDPNKLTTQQRESIQARLEDLFGTPAEPRVGRGGKTAGDIAKLKLDDETLAEGSRLYRIHCLHCHGLSGDGRGPTAFWVNPHPRDYRPGIFKFTSIKLGTNAKGISIENARRQDLLRTLREGIDGSSMPSFGILPEKELEAMVSYVIHLSLRGQVEAELLLNLLKKNPPGSATQLLTAFTERWRAAQESENLIVPEPYPYSSDPADPELKAAVQRGYKFFIDSQQGCVQCHTDFGRQAKFRYDVWGTLVRPANLTTGVYRGGRRPIDIYWRVYSGIPGSGMAAITVRDQLEAAAKDKKTPTTPIKSIWDVVKFVELLPYPDMLRRDYAININ